MPRDLDPQRIPQELELARTLIDNGELDEAKSIITGVILLQPPGDDLVEAFYLRGELFLAAGDARQALLAYETAEAGAPKDSEVLRGKGECLFQLWEFDRARAALETALRADPKNGRAHRYLAIAL